jgi:transaldolase/glucose-6-phosphate isomerase
MGTGTVAVAKANPLVALAEYGQSVWLDFIRRSIITTGELHRMVQEDGLRGVTSNPAIFEKAIAGSTDYTTAFEALQGRKDLDAMGLYEELAIRDIQDAADVMRPVYDRTNKKDGYVSLEVSPYLARETQASINEARRLWKAVARPNVMIKIPGTPEGLPAIEQCISEGINVNVTLLFSMEAYEAVAEAYIKGVEKFVAGGGDPSHVASVASFFISRIDSLVDQIAEGKIKTSKNPGERALLRSVLGKVAIANAKITYQRYKEIYSDARWKKMAAKNPQPQRLLWASTSTKNPNYRDVTYVEELIGPDTVNTIPPATFDAFRDHGKCRPSLEASLDDAHDTMSCLEQVGISFKAVTDQLLDEGIKVFNEAFDKLLSVVEKKRHVTHASIVARQTYKLADPQAAALKAAIQDWRNNSKVRRLWARDASLWTNTDEAQWLGWLGVTEEQLGSISHLTAVGDDVKREGFKYCLLLGMGGSSLCPEVMKMTFGKIDGYPELHVLDSSDPAQVKAFEAKIDYAKTIFIVSSKSGTTLEPNIFKQYFFERAKQVLGADKAPGHFIAITDPRSKMERVAGCDGFRHIMFGLASIGGRYSALSDFGMVPSAVMGLDVKKLLNRAEEMVQSCASCVPVEDNPGVVLGLIMGTLAKQGRDKVTIITSPGIWDLGAWLEQLLAESTGKEGKGLIPVDQEKLGAPEVYGDDRLFCYLRLEGGADAAQDRAVEALEKAGHPVVRIAVAEPYDIPMEFFRWEIATAVAGSVIGINAFNQPDVEASKVATRKLTNEYEKTGSLPAESPILEDGGIKLYTDEANAKALAAAAGSSKTLAAYIKAHLGRIKAGDYFAVLGYVEMNDAHGLILQAMRHAVRDKKRVATCLGFGPRFLHSTGQAYKGGPNSGVFLQITCDDAADLPVPGQKYTFGVVKAAQARGDFAVLAERGRRALRVHLGKDVKAGLETLKKAIEQSL